MGIPLNQPRDDWGFFYTQILPPELTIEAMPMEY